VADIVPLAEQFLAAAGGGRLTDGARAALGRHSWPGNVRELKNLIQRASVLAVDAVVDESLIAPWLGDLQPLPRRTTLDALVGLPMAEVERRLIEHTLARFGGNRAKTAAALGISVRTLFNRMRQSATAK
jgi:DNA-binding NtrC family response regulator